MRVLFIGDVVGEPGLKKLEKELGKLKQKYRADFTIVQGENISARNGISRDEADRLRYCGADVITLGNHALSNKDIYSMLDEEDYLVRPANYSPDAPGQGFVITDTPLGTVMTVSLSGQINMLPCDSPFRAVSKIFEKHREEADHIFIDFHGEATSEKTAFAYYVDGIADAVFGTHTHVQTADERILPKGTAFITDAGMTGVIESVIGVSVDSSIKKFTTGEYVSYEQASGPAMINGVITDTDNRTIERIFAV